MLQSLPSLNSLRAFEAAGRHLSFSKAADELHVTPAAVSQQVKALEEHLGVQLFHRLSRGLALTDAGLAGLPQLRSAFCGLVRGVEQIRGADTCQLLAVESAPSFAAKWLLPRLPRFSERQPEIDLRLSGSLGQIDAQASELDVRDDFRTGEVTVSIRFGAGEYPGCRVDPLFRVAAVPLCRPSLLTGERPLRAPEDLQKHRLLRHDTPWEGRPEWANWFAKAGVTGVDIKRGPKFNSVHLLLQAAMEGQGVALGVEALAADDITAGRLAVPFDIRLPLENEYFLVTLEEMAHLPRVEAFRDWILGEAATFRTQFPEPEQFKEPGSPELAIAAER